MERIDEENKDLLQNPNSIVLDVIQIKDELLFAEISYQNNDSNSPIADSKKYSCKICETEFKYKSTLVRHEKNQHKRSQDYKCPKCRYKTNYKFDLQKHLNTHNDVKEFLCEICKIKFKQKLTLQRHIKDKHTDIQKKFKCIECHYQTNHKCGFLRHLDTHTYVKNFECDICKIKFTQVGSLNSHMRDQHTEGVMKRYKCPQCPYGTNHKGNSKKHLNTHMDVKPFQCDVCELKFSRKTYLDRHKVIKHMEDAEKPYYKCAHCPYGTNYRENLQRHFNMHNGVKPYQCNVCKMEFAENANLKIHMRDKHIGGSEKDYKCTKCSYQTNRKNHLRRHLNTHNDM